jgi:glycerol uptake facilitator-like aquaporin
MCLDRHLCVRRHLMLLVVIGASLAPFTEGNINPGRLCTCRVFRKDVDASKLRLQVGAPKFWE